MTPDDYIHLLEKAAASKFGLALEVGQGQNTLPPSFPLQQFRRRLYYARENARKAGNRSFDDLSMLLRPDGEVWIVKRQCIRNAIRKLREYCPNIIILGFDFIAS